MAIGRLDNLYQLWGILVLAGLGIGGIVVPASIITTIICPDVSFIVLGYAQRQRESLTMNRI